MWITRLEVENFGRFDGRWSFNFGTANPKMLTVLSGIGGSGKSTLVAALWWLFNGSDDAPNSLNLRTPLNTKASEGGVMRYSIRATVETVHGFIEVEHSSAIDAVNQIEAIGTPMFVTDELLHQVSNVQDESTGVGLSHLRALESIVVRLSKNSMPVPLILDDCIDQFDNLTLTSCWHLLDAYKGQVIVTTTKHLEQLQRNVIPASVICGL